MLFLPYVDRYVGIINFIDHFSKFALSLPIKNKNSAHISEKLELMITLFPTKIVTLSTDGGKEFCN